MRTKTSVELSERFSTQRDSEELASRIGERRVHISNLIEELRFSDLSYATQDHLRRVYSAMLREAA